MTNQTQEMKPNNVREDRERERRRKRYKFALVKWKAWDSEQYVVEYKSDIVWKEQFMGHPEVICDDQPQKVLRGMLKLLKENEE